MCPRELRGEGSCAPRTTHGTADRVAVSVARCHVCPVLCRAGSGPGVPGGGGRPADALWVPQEGCSAGEMVSKKQHCPRVAGKAASGVSTLTTDSWVRGPVRGQLHAHRLILEDTAQRTGPGPAPAPSLWGTGKWALRPAPYSRPGQPPSMCH